ncbi:transposase for insertion sequence [Corynebacterium diphtheriae]|nr:transposase for insertion sequence [Corynebacterium diphtheriae]
MQPNRNAIVDTICRTAELGETITRATEHGDSYHHRSLVDLPIVGYPTHIHARLPHWPCLRTRQFNDHGQGDPLNPATPWP